MVFLIGNPLCGWSFSSAFHFFSEVDLAMPYSNKTIADIAIHTYEFAQYRHQALWVGFKLSRLMLMLRCQIDC